MYTIATLEQVQQYLGITSEVEDVRLGKSLRAASAQIERLTQRYYTPRWATVYHDVRVQSGVELFLNDDLLELTALEDASGLIPLEDVLPPLEPGPVGLLALRAGRTFTWRDSPERAVAVTGVWGWHDRWSEAWRDSGDALRATLDTSSQTVSVASITAPDTAGEVPRFQVGQLWRVDAEAMRVIGVTPNEQGADSVQVLRGVSGTTATSHALNAPIVIYQPPQEVVQLVVRWAAWLYREPDYAEERPIPADLMTALLPLRRLTVLA
ncbi:MAG: hypothetical protein OHK0046_16540 [Anaerolineae bacterium]